MMAACITHPIDQTKIRSQVQYPRQTMLQTARNTIATSGVSGLWAGLSGSLLRQGTYGAARFGLYNWLKDRALARGERLSVEQMVFNGALAGGVAGVIGAPAELVMVRLSSDGVKPENKRLHYRNAIDGLYKIARNEGFTHIFRGWGMASLRSVLLNASQMTCYDVIKARLLRTPYFTDSIPLHLVTATLGGTISITICAPVDMVKSRLQSSTNPRTTAMSIVTSSIRNEGVRVLFRGWLPAWLRMVPNTCLTFVFFEQLKRIF
ncbi:hypothetical protein VHUM_03036 [Vanrija humicola]|uniref:Uncharacterized protein n=1 Tax=Vanrija humicola TaxID=5417 RepID=A0A7D8V1A6_VANHU|nr:hypothetical protein VHUM_03036 [Vanrija humicola]